MAAVPFFFVGKLVDPASSAAMASYGGYFPFVLLGLACSRFVTASLSAFGGVLREEQLQGTLEAMLLSPASLASIILGGALWPLVWTSIEVMLYLLIGAVLFGVSFSQINTLAALTILPLLILSLSSLGLFSACGLLLYKEADPVNWLLGGLMRLLGGVYFPIALLPQWLAPLAKAFPLTHGLEGIRQAVLAGASLNQLGGIVGTLFAFSLISWPLAGFCFVRTLRRLKTTGALNFR